MSTIAAIRVAAFAVVGLGPALACVLRLRQGRDDSAALWMLTAWAGLGAARILL